MYTCAHIHPCTHTWIKKKGRSNHSPGKGNEWTKLYVTCGSNWSDHLYPREEQSPIFLVRDDAVGQRAGWAEGGFLPSQTVGPVPLIRGDSLPVSISNCPWERQFWVVAYKRDIFSFLKSCISPKWAEAEVLLSSFLKETYTHPPSSTASLASLSAESGLTLWTGSILLAICKVSLLDFPDTEGKIQPHTPLASFLNSPSVFHKVL